MHLTPTFLQENTIIPASDPTFDQLGFTAKKVGFISRISNELGEDAAINLASYWMEDAGNGLGLLEDDCGINGDGTSTYGGITGVLTTLMDSGHTAARVAAAATHHSFVTITSDDVFKVMAQLPDRFWPNARIYCSAVLRSGAARCPRVPSPLVAPFPSTELRDATPQFWWTGGGCSVPVAAAVREAPQTQIQILQRQPVSARAAPRVGDRIVQEAGGARHSYVLDRIAVVPMTPDDRRRATTRVLIWRGQCATCSKPFEYSTWARGYTKIRMSRRCPEHRRPGAAARANE